MDILPVKSTLNPPYDMSMTLALHWLQEPGSPTLGLLSLIHTFLTASPVEQ